MVIGLISDTHGLLREDVIKNLEGCDLIVHAGDIGNEDVIHKLQQISNLEIIKGNCDRNIDKDIIPNEKIVEIDNIRIYLIHDIKELEIDLHSEKIDIVVYGHSHKKNIYTENGIIYINPGSVGPRRFKLPITMAKLYLNKEKSDYSFHQDDIINIGDYCIEFININ